MNNLKKILLSSAILLSGICGTNAYSQNINVDSLIQAKHYPLKNGFPTPTGVDSCVKNIQEPLIKEVEKFFGISISEMSFESDDLEPYLNATGDTILGNELGLYDERFNSAIIAHDIDSVVFKIGFNPISNNRINTDTLRFYLGYSLKTTKKGKLSGISETGRFVKGAMIHELGHNYIAQIIGEMLYQKIHASPEYIRVDKRTIGSKFIEEGICQYLPAAMGELLPASGPLPKSLEDLTKNYTRFYYSYSELYLRKFLKEKGVKKGIQILIANPPPTEDELVHPDKYFKRLKSIEDFQKAFLLLEYGDPTK